MIESAEEFYQLRTSELPEEYSRAAQESASLETWLKVSEKYPEMRFRVAQNKTVPVEVLEVLSQDTEPQVRSMVAMKRKLPEHLQVVLARDKDDSVRRAVVWNVRATYAALKILAGDAEPEIREQAKDRLAKSEWS